MLEALQGIPDPPTAVIDPHLLASYGALVAAGLLSVLYLYRGRAFIVYWILSWTLLSASLLLESRGYDDVRIGAVMLGIAHLLKAWSAGLLWLGAHAFPDAPLRWNLPLRVAAISAVWFVAAPLLVPLRAILVTGQTISGFILAWAGIQYLRLFRAAGFYGAGLTCAGLGLFATANLFTAGVLYQSSTAGELLNQVLALNIITNIFVALGMHLLVFEDMTAELRRSNRDLAAANEEVRRLAITDSLTGCYNRLFFDQIERRELQRHLRYRSPLTVMFVDVNKFKKLNDTLGHETGDAVLRQIGTMLRRQVRSSDYVIRWGGDEFMLLLTCTFEQAQQKAAELKAAFSADPATGSLPGGVGLSIGAAQVEKNVLTLGDAIRLADERMYENKFSDPARVET